MLTNARRLIKLFVATGSAVLICASAASAAVVVGQAAPSGTTASGGYSSWTFFQSSESGSEGFHFGSPITGVATGFTMRLGATVTPGDTVRVDMFRPIAGGNFKLVAVSPLLPIFGSADTLFSPAIRVPVQAGDRLGITLDVNAETQPRWISGGATSSDLVSQIITPVAVGDEFPIGATTSQAYVNASLKVEPDFDNDTFGDETQDLCPTNPATSSPCPDTTAPIITQFKTAFKRFRYKPKGLVVSRRAHPGTTIAMNLSEPATVTFSVTKAFKGKITKGICKKAGKSNAKNRRCTKLIVVHTFSRQLNTGVNSFPYSARYKDAKGRIGTLRPGPYRLTATPVDGAGNVGAVDFLAFKIRR
jgi:opacity protein-like surface antigen